MDNGGGIIQPLIGITMSYQYPKHELHVAYSEAIVRAGGVPLLLPIGIEQAIPQLVKQLDGLLLTGGGDVSPTYFQEEPHLHLGEVSPERDRLEYTLLQQMIPHNKPILGICRGHQFINLAFGGSLYQDIYTQTKQTLIQHEQKASKEHPSHFVTIHEGTKLHKITQRDQLFVNSFHHQAVRTVPTPLTVSASTSDGLVEAIESTAHDFIIGVQWHPETLREHPLAASQQLFNALITACQSSK